jgi:hypothetical protein
MAILSRFQDFFYSLNDPAELWAAGPSAQADCSRARISARGNVFNPLKLSGIVPEARSAEGTLEISGGCKPSAELGC